jgi:hypothetical protein
MGIKRFFDRDMPLNAVQNGKNAEQVVAQTLLALNPGHQGLAFVINGLSDMSSYFQMLFCIKQTDLSTLFKIDQTFYNRLHESSLFNIRFIIMQILNYSNTPTSIG